MSKKITPSRTLSATKSKVAAAKLAPVATAVRYTALPKATVPAAKAVEVTSDMIARKAYELYAAGRAGSEMDHWLAAEAELRTAA